MNPALKLYAYDRLNSLSSLLPLGTLSEARKYVALPAPEPEAPDHWNWLPPGMFPPRWTWLEKLAEFNLVRLTYKVSENFVVRVYAVPTELQHLKISSNRKIQAAVQGLLLEVNTSESLWHTGKADMDEGQQLLRRAEPATLSQIYNNLESPSDVLALQTFPLHIQQALEAIQKNNIPALSSMLYPYQSRTVQRMLLKETFPSSMLDPRLLQLHGPLKNEFYLELETMRFWTNPVSYDAPKGGILGEEMGSGKTCESLALILATLDQMPANPACLPGSEFYVTPGSASCVTDDCIPRPLKDIAAEVVQRSTVSYRWNQYELSQNCLDLLDQHRPSYVIPFPAPRIRSRRSQIMDVEDEESIVYRPGKQIWLSHATLIVVPDTLVSQWRHEITKHIQADILKVLVISTTETTSKEPMHKVEDLLRFDVVLMSHSRFSREEQYFEASQPCSCPYIGRTRETICNCPPPVQYISPLTSIHWKRLIVDEGHTMSSLNTKAVRFAASLHVERRWMVSGTPTRGLVGASADGQEGSLDERLDLQKLGVTMIDFLGLQALDKVTWRKFVTKPFLERQYGSEQVVRTLLNTMIVRNRIKDIQRDVVLPPLTKNVVLLAATEETALTLNIFNALIAINAVTSQRVDQDYFFHKSQAASLQAVVRNMLVSTFHWTGTTLRDVDGALSVATQALKVLEHTYSEEDRRLLRASIAVLSSALSNPLWLQMSEKHEMGYHLSGRLPEDVLPSYVLTQRSPKILGGTATLEAQKAVRDGLGQHKTEDVTYADHLTHHLLASGIKNRAHEAKLASQLPKRPSSPTESERRPKRTSPNSKTGLDIAKKAAVSKVSSNLVAKRNRQVTEAVGQVLLAGEHFIVSDDHPFTSPAKNDMDLSSPRKSAASPGSIRMEDQARHLSCASQLASIKITATSSAKLNYLLTQLQLHSKDEKVLVFSDFVDHTFHIAEALDIIGIPYLLYTSSLKPSTKNRYILTFNTSETFRVMIMDLNLAAHGLNLSSASRVYFVQQCWSGAIESQAIKRAHRIGQTRPVKVEVLALRGSIEEAMHKRRLKMTGQQLGDTKAITDDHVLREAIKNPTFLQASAVQELIVPACPLFTVEDGSSTGTEALVSADATAIPFHSAATPTRDTVRKRSQAQQVNPAMRTKRVRLEHEGDASETTSLSSLDTSAPTTATVPSHKKTLRFNV